MEKKVSGEKSLCDKIISLMLVVVMMVSLIGSMPEAVSAADFAISDKKSVIITDANSAAGSYHYIKYKAKATGYVTFSVAVASKDYAWASGSWWMCDSKKRPLSHAWYDTRHSDGSNDSDKKIIYGVQKGKTYYLHVHSYEGVKITANFKKVTPAKSGSTQSKAKKIKRGKTIRGIIPVGSGASHWYKFKLSKAQYVKVCWSVKTNFGIDCSVFPAKKYSGGGTGFTSSGSQTASAFVVGSSTARIGSKVPAGTTFYVRVRPSYKYNGQSSGYYTFKWK